MCWALTRSTSKRPSKQIENGAPVDAGAFHRHLGHALAGQPVGQVLQAGSGGGEGAHLVC